MFLLVTYHSSKWIINFIISPNKESNWENKASIDYFSREKINEEFYCVHSKYHF